MTQTRFYDIFYLGGINLNIGLEGSPKPTVIVYCTEKKDSIDKDLLIQMGFNYPGSTRALVIVGVEVIKIDSEKAYFAHTIPNVQKGQVFELIVTETLLGQPLGYLKKVIKIK